MIKSSQLKIHSNPWINTCEANNWFIYWLVYFPYLQNWWVPVDLLVLWFDLSDFKSEQHNAFWPEHLTLDYKEELQIMYFYHCHHHHHHHQRQYMYPIVKLLQPQNTTQSLWPMLAETPLSTESNSIVSHWAVTSDSNHYMKIYTTYIHLYYR